MKHQIKSLVICILIPIFVGILSSILSKGGMELFSQLNKPPFSPPGWLFPIVWTILYIMMGIASYLIYISYSYKKDQALLIYTLQLFVNFFWSIFFFRFEWYFFSFIWIILLILFVILTISLFYPISKLSAYLLIPYLLWIIFAGYLNFGIYLLN